MSVNVLTDDGLAKIAGNVDNQKIIQKFEELESLIEQTRQLRADLENYGLVKLSNASNVTDSSGLALPVTEKNPEIDGTLANSIENYFLIKNRREEGGIDFDLNNCLKPGLNRGVIGVNSKNAPPFNGTNYFYLITIVFSERTGGYGFTGKHIAIGYTNNEVFSRFCFNDDWTEWKKISSI